ncbi:MAG: hemerythrin domain-containing protein, partial [Alphaproteobacteria bacterium]
MITLLDRLGAEHRNMARLLHVAERQLDRLAAAERPDYFLLGLLLDYFLDFPDQVHHPKEDMLLGLLQARAPDAAAEIGGLLAEHRDLALRTRRFADAVREISHDGAAMERDELVRLGRDFVDFYFHHMHEENEIFFPVAAAYLTDADWASADVEGRAGSDPLFGGTADMRFPAPEPE